MRLSFNISIRPFLLTTGLIAASCRHEKVKVVISEYSQGKPEIIYYFNNQDDARQFPIVTVKDGVGYANKPISFDEERYYKNGKLQAKGSYVKGQTCGLWQYFYESGVPQAKCYYWNGITCDTVYCWYPSGRLKRIFVETDTAKRQWHGIEFYENGKKGFESNMLSDSADNMHLDGGWSEWFSNGGLKMKAIMKNNWTVGKWQKWDSAGKLEEGEKPMHIFLE